MSFNFLNQLPSPEEIKKEYPLPEKLAQIKKERDAAIRKVLTGEDNRFLVSSDLVPLTVKNLSATTSAA